MYSFLHEGSAPFEKLNHDSLEVILKLRLDLQIGKSELDQLTQYRESDIGAIRNLREVTLNLLLKNILTAQGMDYLGSFGKMPDFSEFCDALSDDLCRNEFAGVIEVLAVIVDNWSDLEKLDPELFKIARACFNEALFYFEAQLLTKLGEGIVLDENTEAFRVFNQENHDSAKSLLKFIDQSGLRKRKFVHKITRSGIGQLRSHYAILKNLPYLTREPVEHKNLRLLEILSSFRNLTTFEISPPFYDNENDFVLRCSVFNGVEWEVRSFFINLRRDRKNKIDYEVLFKVFERIKALFEDQKSLNDLGIKKYKNIRTLRSTGDSKLLKMFASVFCIEFDSEDFEKSIRHIINYALQDATGASDSLKIFDVNDRYVSDIFEPKIIPHIKKYTRKTLEAVFGNVSNELADQLGVVVHSAKLTLTPKEKLKSMGLSEKDILDVHNGVLLSEAVNTGRSGVDRVVKQRLSVQSIESDFDSSCGETTQRFGSKINEINTVGWISSESSQTISGVGTFQRVEKVDPEDSNKRLVLYRCKACGEASIDACEVLAGCQNSRCLATYSENVQLARSEASTPKVHGDRTLRQVNHLKFKPSINKPARVHSKTSPLADDFFRGALSVFTGGLSNMVDSEQ